MPPLTRRFFVTRPARSFVFALLLCAAASPALASIKVYDSTKTGGQGGDVLLYVASTCTPVSVKPGALSGLTILTDPGGGTVTLDSLSIQQKLTFNVDTTAVFGPGAFFFATQVQTDTPLEGQTGTGNTSPSGSVSWGVLAGWSSTGLSHCIASPAATCVNNGFLHGSTIPSLTRSPTYDLGTWTFDAEGDFAATAYIEQTANGGESNIQWLLRGAYVGPSVPALPLIGLGALAAAVLVGGARSVLTGRNRS